MNTQSTKWTKERIKDLRKRLGYDQDEMATALGFSSYRRISELENGKRDPSAPVARLLDMLEGQAANAGKKDQ